MLLPDVNVLIYAHFENIVAEQAEYARWVTRLATGSEPFAHSVLVLSGFVRIATNPRTFDPTSTLENAFAFVSSLVERPTARIVGPGPDHLEIFERLCREAGATGKLVADAQHAAIAVKHGCTLVSTDSDFNRFAEVRWHRPLPPTTCRSGAQGGHDGSMTTPPARPNLDTKRAKDQNRARAHEISRIAPHHAAILQIMLELDVLGRTGAMEPLHTATPALPSNVFRPNRCPHRFPVSGQ